MARKDYLSDEYTEADKKLIKIFQEEVKKLDLLYFRAINSNNGDKAKEILNKIKEISKVLKANYEEWADYEIPKEYLKGATYIDDTIEGGDSLGIVLEADKKEIHNMIKSMGPAHLEAVNALLNTSKNYVKSSLDGMERQAITMLSELEGEKVREELARGTLLGENLADMKERIKRYFVNNKISGFKDRAGRIWSMDRYVDMLTRTETSIANVQGTINRAIQLGHTKFKVIEAPDCCDYCADENGKVVDIAKGTVDLPPFHPNCRGYIVVVLDNGEEVSNNEDIRKEQARQKLKDFKITKTMLSEEEDVEEAYKYIKEDSPFDFDDGIGFDNAVCACAYTGDCHKYWNEALRKGEINEFGYFAEMTESLESSIYLYGRKSERTLYRGTNLPEEVFNKMSESLEYVDKAFLSFSKEEEQATHFVKGYGGVKVIFELEEGVGLDMEGMSLYSQEEEVLINRETKFKVESINKKFVSYGYGSRGDDVYYVKIKQG